MSRAEEAVEESVSKCYSKHGFFKCIGAIDGTHVQKNSHQKVATDYITREGSYTVKNEAAADYKYCFVDVMIK